MEASRWLVTGSVTRIDCARDRHHVPRQHRPAAAAADDGRASRGPRRRVTAHGLESHQRSARSLRGHPAPGRGPHPRTRLPAGGPQPALWSVGGFTFDLAADTVITRSSTQLEVTGTGIVSAAGFTPTPGDWDFIISNVGGATHTSFSFVATTATVPDGGSAVALLGIALTGIEAARRMIRARKA